MVLIRQILLSYDQATNDEDKEKELKRLRDHISYRDEYTKPTNLKKIRKNEEAKGAAAGDDTSEEEDEELRKYQIKFD
jgi:hypothetical protein